MPRAGPGEAAALYFLERVYLLGWTASGVPPHDAPTGLGIADEGRKGDGMTPREREKKIQANGDDFASMYDVHIHTPCGSHDAERWIAIHVGKLTARMEMLEREVRALRKKVTG